MHTQQRKRLSFPLVRAFQVTYFFFIASLFDSFAVVTSAMSVVRKVGKLDPTKTCLFVCDVQERFRSLIHHSETVIQSCRYMTSVAEALSVPLIVTEQYPKVFGPTVKDCFASGTVPTNDVVFEKKRFSMLTEPVKTKLQTPPYAGRTSVLLVGIEAHVCVQQTCLDLLEQGDTDVHVIVDGVSSQQPIDRTVALRRMEQAGALLTTAQSAAFMLMQSADHPNFKQVSKLTVEHMKLPNAFNVACVQCGVNISSSKKRESN